jgi:outer membrane lipoprotein-sorting protein
MRAGPHLQRRPALAVELCYHTVMRLALLAAVLSLVCGCPHGAVPQPSGPAPTVAEVVERLTKAKDELHSFTGSAVMEYWLGGDRFKGDVLAMGETGSKVRVAVLSPAGGSTLAEMACDGSRFVSVNYQNNCVLSGPCKKQSIATFFGIELDPDDFLHLALGTPPVVGEPRGEVTWDAGQGLHHVELEGTGGKQTFGIDGRWDVVESALIGTDGKPVWSVKNAAFDNAKDPDGKDHRVPGKSHFTTPNHQKADLTVEWRERTVNVTIDPKKFTIAVPAGLPTCGRAPPTKK